MKSVTSVPGSKRDNSSMMQSLLCYLRVPWSVISLYTYVNKDLPFFSTKIYIYLDLEGFIYTSWF